MVAKLPPALADPLAHDEDPRVAAIAVGQRFQRRLHERELARRRRPGPRRAAPAPASARLGVNVIGGRGAGRARGSPRRTGGPRRPRPRPRSSIACSSTSSDRTPRRSHVRGAVGSGSGPSTARPPRGSDKCNRPCPRRGDGCDRSCIRSGSGPAGAGPVDGLAGDLGDGEDVVAVDLDAGHAVAGARARRRSGCRWRRGTGPRWRTRCSRRRTAPAASRCRPYSAPRGRRRC